MNFQHATALLKLARTMPDPHAHLITEMGKCKTANDLAIPLCAYSQLDSNFTLPQTPMFVSAQTIIDNALYYEEQEFARKLGFPEVTFPGGPKNNLCTDYNMTMPSDQARREAAALRDKHGQSTGLTRRVKTGVDHHVQGINAARSFVQEARGGHAVKGCNTLRLKSR